MTVSERGITDFPTWTESTETLKLTGFGTTDDSFSFFIVKQLTEWTAVTGRLVAYGYLVHRLVDSLQPEPLYIIQTTDVIKAIGSFVDLGEKSAIDDAFKKHLHTVQVRNTKRTAFLSFIMIMQIPLFWGTVSTDSSCECRRGNSSCDELSYI